MKLHVLIGLELFLICSSTWTPLFSMEERKRKRTEEPKALEEQPEIKREKLEEERSNVPTLFQLTLPYLRQYALQLLNQNKSIGVAEDQPIPIEVFSKIFNDPLFFGNTMFHLIADSNDVASLLQYKADPNIRNADGQTVLNYYLVLRKTDAAKKLLELAQNNLDIVTSDYFGSTPLLNAIKTSDYEIVESIINRALGNPEIDIHSYILQANGIRQTPCTLAIIYAPDLLPLLIPYINFEDEYLLITAVRNNDAKSIKILLENGYPVDLADANGWPALMYAVEAGNEVAVNELLKYKQKLTTIISDPNNPEEKTTLAQAAAQSGNPNIILKLLQAGFPIDFGSIGGEGGSMLSNAALASDLELVKFLLENGADPNKGHMRHMMYYPGRKQDALLDATIFMEFLKNPRTNTTETDLLTMFLRWYLEKLPLETTLQIVQLFIERGSPITNEDLKLTKEYPEIYKLLEQAQSHQ